MTDQISVLDLARRFISAWGSGRIELPPSTNNALHEAHLLHLAIDKAACDLKWFPCCDSETAIEWTVDWYKAWHTGCETLMSLSLEQIGTYLKMAFQRSS
ncbi:MAG: hypothetical protein NTZ24_14980 [Deltaproteobacteria bacterium]|nr:hypothetical protein [Deltaproteobacteria bacterium]